MLFLLSRTTKFYMFHEKVPIFFFLVINLGSDIKACVFKIVVDGVFFADEVFLVLKALAASATKKVLDKEGKICI